jgi:uncharacterized protein (DUF1778 family)
VVAKTSDKSERLEARVTPAIKAMIQRAADREGRSLTDFMIGTLVEAAQESEKTEEILKLSRRDSELFFDLLANSPEPTDYLKQAVQQHRNTVIR